MSSTELEVKSIKPVNPFYITGLPRSRTAWLAVAMSDWRVSACLHEPLVRADYRDDGSLEIQSLTRMFVRTHCPYVGLSDSGLSVMAPDLPEIAPGPILVVRRDPEEVVDSLTRYLGGERDVHAGGVALMQQALDAFVVRHAALVKVVEFDALGSTDIMRQIWHHLLPSEIKFQRRRVESLQPLRIDPDPARVLEGATDSAVKQAQARYTMPVQDVPPE